MNQDKTSMKSYEFADQLELVGQSYVPATPEEIAACDAFLQQGGLDDIKAHGEDTLANRVQEFTPGWLYQLQHVDKNVLLFRPKNNS